jgi:hypothetical protein
MWHFFVKTIDEESHFRNVVYVILSCCLKLEGAFSVFVLIVNSEDTIVKFRYFLGITTCPGTFEY